MFFKNKRTGGIVETEMQITGDEWEQVECSDPSPVLHIVIPEKKEETSTETKRKKAVK